MVTPPRTQQSSAGLCAHAGANPRGCVYLCNRTLTGEQGVCLFICFGKFAWENRAPLFPKLLNRISPQCPAEPVTIPQGQLDTRQLHVLLTGALPSDGSAGPTARSPLLALPHRSKTWEQQATTPAAGNPSEPQRAMLKTRLCCLARLREPRRGCRMRLSASPRKVRAVCGASHGHSRAAI